MRCPRSPVAGTVVGPSKVKNMTAMQGPHQDESLFILMKAFEGQYVLFLKPFVQKQE